MLLLLLACSQPVPPSDSDSSAPSWDTPPLEQVGDAPQLTLAIEPPGGTFSGSVQVELTVTGGDHEVYYTLDGSEPNKRDQAYEGPFELTESATVRAVVLDAERDPTEVAVTQTYVRLGSDLADFSSNLPLVVLSSDTGVPDRRLNRHDPFALHVFEPGEDGRTRLTDPATLDTRAGLKVRGSSSSGYPKHSYGLELWSALEDDDDAKPVLGMPEESDWVLLAPLNFDRALMRNALIYRISNEMGHYAPRDRFVEVFAVGNAERVSMDHYRGVFVFLERVKRDPGRVDVTELQPDDNDVPEVTGGYVFKEDRLADDESGFEAGTAGGAFEFQQTFVMTDPKEDEISREQQDYLNDYLDGFAEALNSPDFTNSSGQHYSDAIDVDVWIDHHILNTFAKNPDAFRLSGYFHKDREGLLMAGPLWDFDRTFGPAGDDDRARYPTWWDPSNQTSDTTYFFDHGFWRGLFRDPAFTDAYWARWREVLDDEFSLVTLHNHVLDMAAELEEAAPRNYARWPDYPPRGGSHATEVVLLLEWIDARHAWISQCLELPDPQTCTGD